MFETIIQIYYKKSDFIKFNNNYINESSTVQDDVNEIVEYGTLYDVNTNIEVGTILFNNIINSKEENPTFYEIDEKISIKINTPEIKDSSLFITNNYNSIITSDYPTDSKYIISIISGTGTFLNKTGFVVIDVLEDKRFLTIGLNINTFENFQNSVTSPNNIRLDQVVDSLNAFKKAVYNVNYLANLINTHSEAIIKAGRYDTVLKPIVEKEYYNNGDDFWTYSVADNKFYFIWEKYKFWNNLTLDEIIKYNNENNLSEYNELLILQNKLQQSVALERLIQENPNQDRYDNILVSEWKGGLKVYYTQYQKDILRPNEWIFTSSGVYLYVFLPNTDNLDLFSKEYLNFINAIANEVSLLNATDFKSDSIWPYINPTSLPNAKCLVSYLYPPWTNQYIADCFIPGSDFNYPSIIQGVINDLYYSYPPLIEGQLALLTYQVEEDYYLSFAKIVNYNGTLAFKQKSIKINSFFTNQLVINNDTVINGSLEVSDYQGNSIINTDNVNKITSFHTKIGVNQDTHNVKGLIDVNNLSNTNIMSILDNFVNPLLYSDNVLNILQPSIDYDTTIVTIPISYQTDIFVFKVPLLNVIEVSDITFLYVPPEPYAFHTKQWNTDSFLKIQTIVNELNKMLPQIDLNEETKNYVFSFVELLNDTLNFYLCSILYTSI